MKIRQELSVLEQGHSSPPDAESATAQLRFEELLAEISKLMESGDKEANKNVLLEIVPIMVKMGFSRARLTGYLKDNLITILSDLLELSKDEALTLLSEILDLIDEISIKENAGTK